MLRGVASRRPLPLRSDSAVRGRAVTETAPPPGPAPHLRRWALVLLAVLPTQLPFLQHAWLAGDSATGFLGYDTPYYVANGREVFERGNGFSYPNPYDTDPTAPAIYFHWLPWLFGFGVKVLGADPGLWFAGIGVLAALLCGAATLRLVETVLPDARGRGAFFLLTLWGGGVLCLAAALFPPGGAALSLNSLFAYDVPNGWWFPNWGRNLILSTEAVYHLLVALAWLGALQRRWALAFGALALVATTHPFTGVQQLLIFGAASVVAAWRERSRTAWGRAGAVAALAAVFGAYYFVFLNLFPAHRELQAAWAKQWAMPLPTILLAAGLPALVAAWRLHRQHWRLGKRDVFLLVAAGVTFALMKHDWFIPPHQPAHFSRGYNWLPLWLLALPQLQAWAVQLWSARPRLPARAAVVLAAAVAVSDNAVFLAREMAAGEQDRQHLTPLQREMFRWMDRAGLDGVLLCLDPRLSYLSATYTAVRPHLGHLSNTPRIGNRWNEVRAWHTAGETGPWYSKIDYVLIDRRNPPARFAWTEWRELHRNADYILLGR